jgi:hypothetical protein
MVGVERDSIACRKNEMVCGNRESDFDESFFYLFLELYFSSD